MRALLSSFVIAIFLSSAAHAAPITICNPAGVTEDGIYIDALLSQTTGGNEAFPRDFFETIDVRGDGIAEVNDLFMRRGWGDGLPLVPPTKERVDAMIAGYDLPGDFPIATLAPMDGVATVGNIAVNAVMAGCEPRHMPLLAAAVEAVSQDDFDLRGMATTTNPDAVLMIVSGPIVEQMGLNCDTGVFGRGNRANASISRALHLIIQNVGGSRQGVTDMSTIGQPGEFVMFLAENAKATPWGTFHAERGFMPDKNVVTVASVEGYSGVMGIGYTRPEYLDLIAAWMKGHDRPFRSDVILLIAQDTAHMLAREGWTRKSIRAYLRDKAKIPFKDWIAQYHGAVSARKGIPQSMIDAAKPDDMFPKPVIEKLTIIVAGGTGEKSMIMPCWANGHMVSQEIRLPHDWKK